MRTVNSEIGKQLKELEFNVECDTIYKDGNIVDSDWVSNNLLGEGEWVMPDLNTVSEWLQENCGLYINVYRNAAEKGWSYRIIKLSDDTELRIKKETFNEFADCLERGIEDCIKFLKNSKVINIGEHSCGLCSGCIFFINEDAYGKGTCNIVAKDSNRYCYESCTFLQKDLQSSEAAKILSQYQKYRRSNKVPATSLMPQPFLVGKAIDRAIHVLRKDEKLRNAKSNG